MKFKRFERTICFPYVETFRNKFVKILHYVAFLLELNCHYKREVACTHDVHTD